MPEQKYRILPADGGYFSDFSSLHAPAGTIVWPAKNIKVVTHTTRKRWGYSTYHRTLGATVSVLNIVDYTEKDGTAHTIYLTDSDLIVKTTGTNETWRYETESDTVGVIGSVVTTAVVGVGTDFETNGVETGDMFILDDDYTANEEPAGGDTNWTSITTVTDSENLILSAAYTGTAAGSTISENFRIRKVYSVPANEKWAHTIVGDKFIFSNGSVNVQRWTDTGYAVDLNSTGAQRARYLVEYANRLVIADHGDTSSGSYLRDPLGIKWMKENDPTDDTDPTAGSAQMQETADWITNLGVIGHNLMVYKKDSYIIGNRSGRATDPIWFPRKKKGTGLYAPYSLINYLGTQVFLGNDNFYTVEGAVFTPIGDDIKAFFFEQVTKANRALTYGFANVDETELIWIATTASNGILQFVYNWQSKKWYVYDYTATIKCGGLASDDKYYLGSNAGLIYEYSDTSMGDAGSAITAQWVSKRLDFTDQLPQLIGQYRSIDYVKLTYLDHGDISVIVSVSTDGGINWSDNTKTIGTSTVSSVFKTQIYSFIKTGELFNIKITHEDATDIFEWAEMEIGVLPAGEIINA